MLEFLRANFPSSKHYLVPQKDSEEINRFVEEFLVTPFQAGRKHNLWGSTAKALPELGRRIGWVPNATVAPFLNESVEMEIADACAVSENIIQPRAEHRQIANSLLQRFEMESLAQQNPFHLSEGETKLLWLLTQWVKRPEFLIIGYLPSSLSKQRIKQVVDFIKAETKDAEFSPICILGFQKSYTEWCAPLLENEEWVELPAWPKN